MFVDGIDGIVFRVDLSHRKSHAVDIHWVVGHYVFIHGGL